MLIKVLKLTAACFVSALMLSAAQAQTRAITTNGGGAARARPALAALPGDLQLPPIQVQLHVRLGPPAGTPPRQVQSPDTTPAAPLNLSLKAAKAAIEACTADGWRVGVAVTDAAGDLRVGLAANGASPRRVYTAIRKDIAAAAFGVPTRALRRTMPGTPAMLARLKPDMSVLPGAVPLIVGGRVIGAIGASGAMAYEEEKCAIIGARIIESGFK
jgi:uncharacterized protein GlcG (DUF336 family)